MSATLAPLRVASEPLAAAVERAADLWRLPPPTTLSRWAAEHVFLSSEDSAEQGRFRPVAFQVEILDAISDPAVEELSIMKGAQVGWSTILKIACAYFAAYDPAPVLMLQPTIQMAEAFSKDRLAPMIRDTPVLRDLIADPKSRDSGNTILHKRYPGGHLTLAGANSPASLASRPIRVVIGDEVDRYPESAGTEGDPMSLADKRTARFWNRVKIRGGTPTVDTKSRTQALFLAGDQRRWYVPCPLCGHRQILRWGDPDQPGGVKWNRDAEDVAAASASARYQCEACEGLWDDPMRWTAAERGEWTPTNPDALPGRRSYHAWEAMFPGSRLSKMVADFLEAKAYPEVLRTWVNTTLGECWKETLGDRIDAGPLAARRVEYEADPLPEGVCLVLASVDVQKDRLEMELVGVGRGEQMWGLERHKFLGDPASPYPWEALQTHLGRRFAAPSGATLSVARTMVDSGFMTEQVYRFVEANRTRGVAAVKGEGGPGRPLVALGKATGYPNVPLFRVGSDTAKDLVAHRLAVTDPEAPGYWHFPTRYGPDFFAQLTAEERDPKRGRWAKKIDTAPNEALDLRCYAVAALASLNVNLDKLADVVESGTYTPGPTRKRRRGVRRRNAA